MTDLTTSDQIHVELGRRSYDIVLVRDALERTAEFVSGWLEVHADLGKSGTALIVTDANVMHPHAERVRHSLEAAGFRCGVMEISAGEPSKSVAVAETVYDRLVELEADRQTVVIAVGGGVVGDLAGFAAATYARGVPFVQIPTTLLAQVDSSVGGKVGVNHPRGKNLIGAFHQPLGVLIDIATLATLPDREYRAGLAEVVKYGVILDEEFLTYLETHTGGLNARTPEVMSRVVARCCRLKADVVEQDEFERTGLRAVLNYGHTFAHAFEALAGYGQLLHGEAVAIGMICASRLAERRGRIDRAATDRQIELLGTLGLPTQLPPAVRASISTEDVLDRMRLDKKTVAGRLRFVLPQRIGHVDTVRDVPDGDVRAVLEEFIG